MRGDSGGEGLRWGRRSPTVLQIRRSRSPWVDGRLAFAPPVWQRFALRARVAASARSALGELAEAGRGLHLIPGR